ncbi:hypothetical protein ACWDCB_40070 [Streptomyces sp. NPDC001178]
MYAFEGGAEVVDVGDVVFEEVAQALGTIAEQGHGLGGVVGRQDEDADAGMGLLDVPGRNP